ncbi:dihydroorotase [Bifidobacterium bohemicum]|uniref:Dihydroorotase n=1 Tax=Bifidobacterium bohemicum DSM 22767 TaxID=1437606 RepID=A0A086ZJL9_9BIFI|nr:amidohydrolase family protein [Bifidobacterium bohemicum]KFI46719.1 dihydroorotase [Bifidobacterium bohemicum DSM 22767]SCB79712.1 dihydroorotase [Bifidobacterium bohemicum]
MLTIHDIAVWDTGERIDLVVPGVDTQRSLIQAGAVTSGHVDGSALTVAPGLADPHVHFRDPGQTDKETMVSGAAAAAAGGYTRVLIMPNTLPAADGRDVNFDDPALADRSGIKQLREAGCANVLDYLQCYERIHGSKLPVRYDLSVCASVDRAGGTATGTGVFGRFMDLGDNVSDVVCEHPLRAISDDGSAISDQTLERVLEAAKAGGLPVLEHCERHDASQVNVNRGAVSRELGVPGVPAETELAVVERDIEAVRRTRVHVHFQHVSTAAAFDAVRKAKAEGLPITCETAPHYLALSDEAVLKYGSMAKMNPPLRSEADRRATLAAVSDGTVDMIATDHAPHTLVEKSGELGKTPNGIVGLECAYGVCRRVLVESGIIGDGRLIELMALAPERLMGHTPTDVAGLLNASSHCGLKRVLDLGAVEHPELVDMVVLDTNEQWTVDSTQFHSLGRNTPFDGWELIGRPVATVIGSKLVYSRLERPGQ